MGDSGRWYEYTPWPGTLTDDPVSGGGQAFLRSVREVLMPSIRERFRTDDAYLAGVSLGGLMATYACYEQDSVFSGFAAFSPAYGWADVRVIRFADSSRTRPSYRLLARTLACGTTLFARRDSSNAGSVESLITEFR